MPRRQSHSMRRLAMASRSTVASARDLRHSGSIRSMSGSRASVVPAARRRSASSGSLRGSDRLGPARRIGSPGRTNRRWRPAPLEPVGARGLRCAGRRAGRRHAGGAVGICGAVAPEVEELGFEEELVAEREHRGDDVLAGVAVPVVVVGAGAVGADVAPQRHAVARRHLDGGDVRRRPRALDLAGDDPGFDDDVEHRAVLGVLLATPET